MPSHSILLRATNKFMNYSSMLFSLPIILKDKYLTPVFTLSAIIWVVSFSLVYVNILDAANVLVIHFDSFNGADFFGGKSDVFDIIVTAAIIWILNLALAQLFYYRERFLSYLLAGSTLVYMALILLAVNAIINVN